eukprot:scaffold115573_cov38-Cyclotella_meneghiniana.AAC.1
MGEGADPPKPKVAAPRKPYWQMKRAAAKKEAEQFSAPTQGLEKVYFTVGSAKDAVQFVEVKKKLAQYACLNFRHGNDLAQEAIENMTLPTIVDPGDSPVLGANPTGAEIRAKADWEDAYEVFKLQRRAWNEARTRAFQLVLAHCHPEVEEKLEASSKWPAIRASKDVVDLLELIRGICMKHDEVKQGTMSLVELDLQWYLNFQDNDESVTDYAKRFKNTIDLIETFGGRPGLHPTIVEQHTREYELLSGKVEANFTADEKEEILKTSMEEYRAALFLRISNDAKFGNLKLELDNMYLLQHGAYPRTIEEAMRYLQNYRDSNPKRNNYQNKPKHDEGVAFPQVGTKGPCHHCGGAHWLRFCKTCPEDVKAKLLDELRQSGGIKPGGANNVKDANIGFNMFVDEELQECMDGIAQVNVDDLGGDELSIASAEYDESDVIEGLGFLESSGLSDRVTCGRNKLFLDSCATHNIMFASEYLQGVGHAGVALRQNCNAGSKMATQQGRWRDYEFYLNPTGIANLLSWPTVIKEGGQVRYTANKTWEVFTPSGFVLTFYPDTGVCSGMPYLDMDNLKKHVRVATDEELQEVGIVMIETVRNNYEGFTKEQVQRAKDARDALAMMAHPRADRVNQVVSSTSAVRNWPFTAKDLANGDLIFGPDRGAMRGKTTRKKPSKVRPQLVSIPQQLFERIREVVLAADVMFVDGLPFFVTLSRGIKLFTIEYLPSRTAEQLISNLNKVVKLYRRGGYVVRVALMDMEFEPLVDQSEDVLINCTAAREHVTDIERYIRTQKERCRAVVSELPYKDYMPDPFIIRLMYFVAFWINGFPNENGVSKVYSPREIVTGMSIDFKAHARARFGSYIEASEDADITNNMQGRTVPCICLGPSGNVQGSVVCYNLETKKVIKRRTIKPLPMPDRVIKRVISIGKASKRKRTAERLQFLNRHKQTFDWDNEDLAADDEVGLVEPPHETDQLLAEIPGVELESDDEPVEVIQQITETPELTIALAAQQNANLIMSPTPDKIAGVDNDNDAAVISDDEDDDDGDVIYMGDNLDPPSDNEAIDVDEEDDSEDEIEFENNNDIDNDNENVTTGAVAPDPAAEETPADDPEADEESVRSDSDAAIDGGLRRSKRRRRKRFVEYDTIYTDGAEIEDGVLHINPAVEKEAQEWLKISSELTLPTIKEREDRIGIVSPAAAGIDPRALAQLGMPPVEELVSDSVVMHVMGVILAQTYSLNKGLKLFGERGEASVKKELQQLHDLVTYTPVHARELTDKQKREALASLIFLTEKRCGRVKTRACVNGNPQREYIPKENAASPTVMNDSVMITSAIDAHENRRVVTLDIPGAFLHADLDEEVIMLLRGQLAELMVKVDPELYGPYLTKTKKGESILYVKMLKAMYGLLRSALLFYLKLVKDLTDFGFTMNPYDPCVANKIVNGKQLTVAWHVDDLKVSHEEDAVIDELIKYLGDKYGENLAVHRGDVHDYLGVDHDYSEKGVVKLSMINHLEKIFSDFPEEIGKGVSTPASDHLFEVRDPEECERLGKFLDDEKKKAFHHTVAQILFVSTRVRRDVQTVVAFLTTRTKKPDEDDWGKLRRLLRYLKATKHLKLTLSVDKLGVIRWWVDASYNVHDDCRGQTGAMMSLGRGAPISFSRKQKINVRSSCEGELVGIDDAIPTILWARYFIEAQGYTVEQNILYQDNKSTILLANNGRWSAGKRTKHIKSRYFFIKDKVDSGEVEVQHQPTDKMWSDVLTKPKQGTAFKRDRAMLMNCIEDYDDDEEASRTHPQLLPKKKDPVDPSTVTKTLDTQNQDHGIKRRSVLAGSGKLVTWNTSSNR